MTQIRSYLTVIVILYYTPDTRERVIDVSRSANVKLLPSERRRRIRQLAAGQPVLRIDELAKHLEVSEMTIRRDLVQLEQDGYLRRTFGGALTLQNEHESSYLERRMRHIAEKRAIARYAASRVQEHETIALDASTTALALARELRQRNLTIVTNSLDVAQELRLTKAKVILLGGQLRQVTGSFTGPLTLAGLKDLRLDQTFISAKAVLTDGLMDSDVDEAMVKRSMMQHAARTTALLDSSKFGLRALAHICELADLDCLICDNGLPKNQMRQLEQAGVPLHLAKVESGERYEETGL